MIAKLMSGSLAAALAVGAGQALAQAPAGAGPALVIRDAAVRVVVTPENRADVQATLSGGAARLPRVQMRREGGALVVDGGLRDRIQGCGAFVMFGNLSDDWSDPVRPDRRGRVRISGMPAARLTELPFLDVRVPMDARVEASGAVFGSIGRSRSVSLSNTGCGDWTVANTAGALVVAQTGSGDVSAGTAASARASIRGSGDLTLVETAGPLEVDVRGSGDVRVRRAAGATTLRVRGSGDIVVRDGVAQDLDARVEGSGDIRVAAASGQVRLSSRGSGDVRVSEGRAARLAAEVRGSGDVSFGGDAQTAEVAIVGSGDVRLGAVAGEVRRTVRGSGDLSVDGRRLTD